VTATTLDAVTASIVIALQNGIVAPPGAHPIAGVVVRVVALTHADWLTRIFPKIAETGATRDLIDLLKASP